MPMPCARSWGSRPEAAIFWFSQYLKGWTVMERLGEISVPRLVMAGRDDFVFPPEHQAELAAGIPNARLQIIERAGHNPHSAGWQTGCGRRPTTRTPRACQSTADAARPPLAVSSAPAR